MPPRGLVAAGLTLLAAAPFPAAACDLPDEGAAPFRSLVAKVKYLPETEVWAELMSRTRTVVHYILLVGEPQRVEGRCHWMVEVRAEDRLWKRFLVPATGGRVIELPAAKD